MFAIAVITWFVSSKSLWGLDVSEAFPTLSHHYSMIRQSVPIAAQVFDEMDAWEPYYILDRQVHVPNTKTVVLGATGISHTHARTTTKAYIYIYVLKQIFRRFYF